MRSTTAFAVSGRWLGIKSGALASDSGSWPFSLVFLTPQNPR
jgi:hypothetical protein